MSEDVKRPLLSERMQMDAAAFAVKEELQRLEKHFLEACAQEPVGLTAESAWADGAKKRARLGLVREFLKEWWGMGYNGDEDSGSGFDESNGLP